MAGKLYTPTLQVCPVVGPWSHDPPLEVPSSGLSGPDVVAARRVAGAVPPPISCSLAATSSMLGLVILVGFEQLAATAMKACISASG